MVPESAWSRPPITLSRVDLPAPERPSSTTNSPSRTPRSTWTRASTRRPASKCLQTCSTTAASVTVAIDRLRRQDRDVILLEAQTHALLERELLDVRARQLYAAGAVHDHQLVRDHRIAGAGPPRLGRGLAVADLDHLPRESL